MKNFPKGGHLQLEDSFLFLHQQCPLIGENTVVTKFWIQLKWRHAREYTERFTPGFLCFFFFFFASFMEKNPLINFYGAFDHFSWTYEVAMFWMIKLYLNEIDVIHANEHTKHANCGLHVNFWIFLLMSFCFMMKKKNHFKQKLLLWPQVSFKIIRILPILILDISTSLKTFPAGI